MADDYTRASQSWLKPGAELQVWVWLAVLGLPALVLFMIFFKMGELNTPADMAPPAAIHHQ